MKKFLVTLLLVLTLLPAPSFAQTQVRAKEQIVKAQTGTTYTIVNSDAEKLVTFSNASPVAVSIGQAGTGGSFASGWFVDVKNLGAGTVTITPTTSTIGGASTLVLATGQSARIVSNGTNYLVPRLGISDAERIPTIVDANVVYGCVPDTGADQTSCIQSAINTEVAAATNVSATTRVLEFTPGVYTITSALTHNNGSATGKYNSQITIPTVKVTNISQPFLVIRSKNHAGTHEPYGNGVATSGNVTFKTTLTAQSYSVTYGAPFMFGGPDGFIGNAGSDQSKVAIHWQGINFVAPSDPTIGGFNGQLLYSAIIDDCAFSTTDVNLGTATQTEPTHPTGLAFLMPVNTLDNSEIRGTVNVAGWYGGPATSELTTINGVVYSIQNKVCVNVQGPYDHSPEGSKVFCVRNPHNGLARIAPGSGVVTWGSAPFVYKGNFSFEDVLAGNWRTLIDHVYDPDNALYGLITYNHVVAGAGGVTTPLTLNGSVNMTFHGLRDGIHGRVQFVEGAFTNDPSTGAFNFGRLATAGNIFIRPGTTASTAASWDSTYNAIQLGNGVSVIGEDGSVTAANSSFNVNQNAVLNSGWKFIGTGAAANIYAAGGAIGFRVAASGSEGTTIASPWTANWLITNGGHFITPTSNTYDIGASGATRPRTGYFGTSVVAPALSLSSATVPITFTNAAYQSCAGFTSTAGGVLTCTPSTAKVKQGFHFFNGGLDIIRRIQPQTFSYRPGTPLYDSGKTHLGLVAENLKAANPLLVSTTGAGMLQPEPNAIAAVQIAAIKELDARITQLEQENKRLRARLRRRR